MSAAESLQAKAARLRAAAAPAQVRTSAPTEVRRSARAEVRTRRVRLNVDVSPAEHAGLRRLCVDLADELGATAAEVSGQHVMRALLGAALNDPDIRALLLAQLRTSARP